MNKISLWFTLGIIAGGIAALYGFEIGGSLAVEENV